jgi:Winged helix DNA-binding domain
MTADPLSVYALNRATLDRQLLLRRDARPARQAIGHLTALQAQAPLAPYVGLWTRLSGFRHQHLEDLLTERSVVRAHLLRNTVHLLTAEEFAAPAAAHDVRIAEAGNDSVIHDRSGS